ncbi:MAG: hypothetical protein RBT80_11985 [Candidatus Vecturithrix sp.]|nr:hypothetical protein [Candidatus Vecturithrix sp.]
MPDTFNIPGIFHLIPLTRFPNGHFGTIRKDLPIFTVERQAA